jgi:putative dimethyl sulfoxide reductase chaperone
MNTAVKKKMEAAALDDSLQQSASELVHRAQMYHFFELSLAHPGEDGYDYFRQDDTERTFKEVYTNSLQFTETTLDKGLSSAAAFFAKLGDRSYEEVEAEHIGLFSSNFPHLPCPPYGSLFTAEDSDKRLEEMLAIKQFYQNNCVDISDSYDDLPDHLCVELEFAQLMCFREDEALSKNDTELLVSVRAVQLEFLNRFLLPLGNNLADIAAAANPDNLYSDLLETLRCYLLQHQKILGSQVEIKSENQEIQS